MRDVCWRLSSWDPDIASVRYRAAIPAIHLGRLGIASQFSAAPYGILGREPLDAVIFVKAFGGSDVELARNAAREGVPVILDVCDNIFARGYRAHSAENLRLMAEVASVVVTTGPALADVLRDELGSELPLHVIPDPVETEEDVRSAARMLWAEWFRRARRERRSKLPRVLAGITFSRLVPALRSRSRGTSETPHQVLWFGNPGSVQPRFGIVNLLDIAGELEDAAREEPFRLVVMTSDRGAYRKHIEPLRLETEFAPWDRQGVFRCLRESSVVIVPNSRDEFSICKSSNRAVLALAHGVPVVASKIPSLNVLSDVMLFDDFRRGVATYLRSPELAANHLRLAAGIIEREFSPDAVAEAWLQVFVAAT